MNESPRVNVDRCDLYERLKAVGYDDIARPSDMTPCGASNAHRGVYIGFHINPDPRKLVASLYRNGHLR